MKIPISPIIVGALAINVASLLAVSASVVSSRLSSDAAIKLRSGDLALVAKHILADTCLKIQSTTPFKLGDDVSLPGTDDGRSPTSCIFSPHTKQFIFAAYKDGELVVSQIYSRREVRNQISQLKQESKTDDK